MSALDEEAIRALVIAYAERLDAGDLDGVASLFAHAEFRSARGGSRRGSSEVRKVYDPVRIFDDGTPRTKHVLGNLEVHVDETADTATTSCNFVVLQQEDGAPLRAVLSGRYDDRFERADGAWRFVERVVYPELIGDLSQHMGGP